MGGNLIAKPFKNLDLSDLPIIADGEYQIVADPDTGKPARQAVADSGLTIDEFGSIVIAPTKDNITRHVLRVDWTEPADGQFIDIVKTSQIAAGAIDGGNQPIPSFRFELNLTKFGATYDHPFALGYYGNGTTTDTHYWVQEVGYDIASASTLGGGFRSNERYDVVQHVTHDGSPNADWPNSIRCAFGYSTYQYGDENSPTMIGIVVLDTVSFSSAYPNPDGAIPGAFGQYFATGGNNANGTGSASVHSKGGGAVLTVSAKRGNNSNRITSEGQLGLDVSVASTSGTAARFIVQLDNATNFQVYPSRQFFSGTDANLPTGLEVNSTDNHSNASVDIVARNATSGVKVETGAASPTFSYSYANYANRGRVIATGGNGLLLGTHDTKKVAFFQGTNGEVGEFDLGGNLIMQNGHRLGVRTISTLPTPAASTGLHLEVSDSSPAHQEVWCDGSSWRYVGTNTAV